MNKKENLKKLLLFGENKKALAFWYIVRLLPSILVFTGPLLTSLILDTYFPDNNYKYVYYCSFIYIVLTLLRTMQIFFYNNKRNKIISKEENTIKKKMYENVIKSKLSLTDSYQAGELIALNTTESKSASLLFAWSYMRIYPIAYKEVFYTIIVMLFLDYKLAIISTVVFFLSYFILKPLYKKNYKVIEKLQKIRLELSSKTNEFINSYSTNKSLRIEESNLNEIDELLKKTSDEVLKYNKVIYIHKYLLSFISFISTILIVYVGGVNILSGVSSLALIILFRNYIASLDSAMNIIVEFKNEANNNYNAYMKIYNLCLNEKENKKSGLLLKKVDSIKFKHVKMSYDGVNDILKDINLDITKPMKIALVGKSGCGKSTLVNLIPRFYDITGGSILINDTDYKEYSLETLRNNIGYVFQEPVIFHMSIMDNIKYGQNRKVTNKEVIEVCKRIGLHDKITSLENGYNTKIDIYSDKISYGEKQLLNFARTILKNADILILDEVTSNLDLEFEQKVMKATKEVLKNKFSFIIAHRLKTIKEADLIIYIENGKIREMGTHDELISINGKYKMLYNDKKIIIKS